MDSVHLLVEEGKALPQIGEDLPVGSMITGNKYHLHVKSIDEVRWSDIVPGALLIKVSGVKKGVDDGPEAASAKQ